MSNIKTMSKQEFSQLPSYDKNTLEVGKTYKLFDYNPLLNVAYIQTIVAQEGETFKTKTFEVQIEDQSS